MKPLESTDEFRRPSSCLPKSDLEHLLTHQIERKVKGRIDELDVVCSAEAIVVRGWARSYHAKQLAQQAILELTDGFPLLTNQIVVY